MTNVDLITIIFAVATACAVLLILLILFSKNNSQVPLKIILTLVVIVATIFSGIRVISYAKANGGIFGTSANLDKQNQVEVDNMQYNFLGLMLKETTNEDKFSAIIETNDVLFLESNEKYACFVNTEPCQYYSNEKDFLKSSFNKNFYDKDYNLILQDTLYFEIYIYENLSILEVYTLGGQEAVDLWNDYFNRNNFLFTITTQKTEYLSKALKHKITLNFNGAIENEVIEVIDGFDYIIPEDYEVPSNYRIDGWYLDGLQINKIACVNNDYQIDVDIVQLFTITTNKANPNVDTNSNLEAFRLSKKEKITDIPEPSLPGLKFVGWSLDGGETVFDFSNYEICEDLYLTAVYRGDELKLKLKPNGGSLDFNGETYTEETEIVIDFDTKITIDNLTREDYSPMLRFKDEAYSQIGWVTNDSSIIQNEFEGLTPNELYYLIFEDSKSVEWNDWLLGNIEPSNLIIYVQWIYQGTEDYDFTICSDEQMRVMICDGIGLNYQLTNELLIADFFELVTGTEVENESVFEQCDTVLKDLNESYPIREYDETLTTREFLILVCEWCQATDNITIIEGEY